MSFPAATVAAGVRSLDPSGAEAVLLGERERRVHHLAALRHSFAELVAASSDSNADDEHDPEGATIAFERSQLATSIGAAEAELEAVEQAMGRLHAGSYGVCTSCGRPVAPARLQARPATAYCIDCARR